MRVLVTGATGFVGGHVSRALRARGHDVVATGRSFPGGDDPPSAILDVTDLLSVRSALAEHRPAGVVHLAALPGTADSWDRIEDTMRVNVVGAGNVLAAVADTVPSARVVLVGSAHQYGDADPGRPLRETDPIRPGSPYAVSKAAQELLGMAWARRGLSVVATRSFNHIGPGAPVSTAVGSFCAQVAEIEAGLAPPVLRVGDLTRERDFVDVRDVADAYVTLLDLGDPGTVYNVASGVSHAVGEALWLAVDASALNRGDVTLEASAATASAPRGDPGRLLGDPGRLRALGWVASIPFERSVAETLNSHRRRLAARP